MRPGQSGVCLVRLLYAAAGRELGPLRTMWDLDPCSRDVQVNGRCMIARYAKLESTNNNFRGTIDYLDVVSAPSPNKALRVECTLIALCSHGVVR